MLSLISWIISCHLYIEIPGGISSNDFVNTLFLHSSCNSKNLSVCEKVAFWWESVRKHLQLTSGTKHPSRLFPFFLSPFICGWRSSKHGLDFLLGFHIQSAPSFSLNVCFTSESSRLGQRFYCLFCADLARG